MLNSLILQLGASSLKYSFDLGQIRWIAFDAVGTLIFAEPPAAIAYHLVGRKYGTKISEAETAIRFATELGKADMRKTVATSDVRMKSDNDRQLWTNDEHEREVWRGIVSKVFSDVEDAARCFEELFAYFAKPSAWKCYPDVEECLLLLRDRGYQLAIASNFDSRLDLVIDGHPVLSPINMRVISSQVGYRKPSDRFFRSLVQQAGCRPEEILMVGDNYENDIQAARQCGLRALEIRRQPSISPGPDDMRAISTILELADLFQA